jgi:hypothetical protein
MKLLSGLPLLQSGLRPCRPLRVTITFGIRGTGGGTDEAMFGFLVTTSRIRIIMRGGFLAIGLTAVEGGIGLKATGGINCMIY